MSGAARVTREHPRHALAAMVVVGLALARLDALLLFALAALALLLLLACAAPADVAIAAAALLLAGAGLGAARLAAIDADPLAAVGSGELNIRGHAVELPRTNEVGYSLRVRVRDVDSRSLVGGAQLVELRTRTRPPPALRIGSELVARGRLTAVDPDAVRSATGRSYAQYLLRAGVRRRFAASSVTVTGARRGSVAGAVDAIRIRAEDALAFGLASEPAGLLRGMVLGGDAGLDDSTVQDFRTAGLAHILAVSGQNVLLIVILVRAILIALGLGRRWRLAVPAVVIVLYVALCGAQASVIRAGVMGLAALAALAASRTSSRVYALLLAAIAVLALNPRASADVGAQLSFAAVAGIMAFTAPLARRLERLPRWAAEAFAVTAGATIFTAPLMAHHFGVVSVVSLAANVLGEPLIAPIVWLGSLTAAIGQISQPLASLLGAPNSFLLGALISLAHAAAAMPGAQLETAHFSAWQLAASYAAIVLLALAVNGRLPAPLAVSGGRAKGVLACALVVVTAWVLLRPPPALLHGPAVAMLDVGQGDAILVRGSGGCSALIDGGPPGGGLMRQLRELGVRRIDAVVATHAESDHFGGLLDLASAGELPVETLIDGGGNTDRADFQRMRREFAAGGARSIPAVAGRLWRCGDLSIRLVGPAPLSPDAPPPANPNERAAVTVVDAGPLRMLASGDAESPQLASLALPSVDLLKVSHHGSADPGLGQLLARLRPRLALIGVGADNRFGHPVPQVLADLQAAGVQTFRTDRDGEIVVRPAADGGAAVFTRGSER